MESSPGDQYHRLSYLPGEVCVVVSLDESSGVEPGEELYTRVADHLNGSIAGLPRVGPTGQGAGLERDLTPTLIGDRLGRRGIRWLEPATSRRFGAAGHSPWVALPPADGQTGTTCLHFYQMGDVGVEPEDRHRDDERVRELVNEINQHRDDVTKAVQSAPRVGGVRAIAATPNWLVGVNQGGHIGPGPGSRPEPAPQPQPASDRNWRFEFKNPSLTSLLETTTEESVLVAVLDTSPTSGQIRMAALAYPDNWLLKHLATEVGPYGSGKFHVDGPLSIPPSHFVAPPPDLGYTLTNRTRLADGQVPDDHFLMPDHGLFVAGIIRQIAPAAEVHLIRVLSDYGVGDLHSLIQTLYQLPGLLARSGKPRMVANLSLGIALSSGKEALRQWLPATFDELDKGIGRDLARDARATLSKHAPDALGLLDACHCGLDRVLTWLSGREVLVVASAGNDGDDLPGTEEGPRPEPRWPARYDGVLGVAAVARDGRAAAFSNRGDVNVIGNGVAAFGGNALPRQPGAPPTIDLNPPPGSVDAVVGVYTAPGFPLCDKPTRNDTGWAYWVGTSFAAPIISAIAANVWCGNPALPIGDADSPGVIRTVRGFAGDPVEELVTTAIVVDQKM